MTIPIETQHPIARDGNPVRFAVGPKQIGVYHAAWKQTGELISLEEALTRYGKEIVEEAKEYSTALHN